jgi:serine protease Do
MGQEAPEGVVITQVAPNSSGEKAGLLRGDILLEVNRRPVSNPVDYTKVLEKIGKDKVVLLLVRRKEGTRFLTLRSDS